MKHHREIITAICVLVFLSSFRMGNNALPITIHQASDWNTYTAKEITFSLPGSYQLKEPNDELEQIVKDFTDVDSLLFIAYEINPEENYVTIFTISDRYKPDLFDLKFYMAQKEKYLEPFQAINYHDQSFIDGVDSVSIEGQTFYKDAGWFTDNQYVLATNQRIYDIRSTLVSSDYKVTNPHLKRIIQSIQITPEPPQENSPFSPFCMIGLGLILVLFLLNIWMRRKKKNTSYYPTDCPKNI